tara:strand:- start:310 stop:510 length:201 start_codon:yes stop_codon:yes gene_type:complete
MKIYVYEALFNDCIYEGGYVTLSIHNTEIGAKKALHHHEFNYLKNLGKVKKEEYQDWALKKTILQE